MISLFIACIAFILALVAYLKVKDIKVIEGLEGPKGEPGKDADLNDLTGEMIVEKLSKLKSIELPNTGIRCNNFFDI